MKRAALLIVRFLSLGAALVVVAYIAYVHFLRSRVGREYAVEPFDEHFSTRTGSFTFDADNVDVHNTSSDIALTLSGEKPSDVIFRGPVQRLIAGTFRIRYRVETAGPFEVFAGIEKDAPDARRLAFSIVHGGDSTVYRLFGDLLSTGARSTFDDNVPNGRNGYTLDDASDSHEIVLRVYPEGMLAIGEVDGRSVMTKVVRWDAGTPFRMTFGANGQGKHVVIHIERASWEPEEHQDLMSFDERFDGKILNPRRWMVIQSDPWRADSTVAPMHGGGLHLTAHGNHFAEIFPAIIVRTKRVPLHSFHLTARVAVITMNHAAIFVGVAGASHTIVLGRAFDVGFISEPDFVGPFVSAHASGDGRLKYDPLRELAEKRRATLELFYDAKTSQGRALVDGELAKSYTLDLKPLDEVAFRFGVNMQGEAGELDAVVEELKLETP